MSASLDLESLVHEIGPGFAEAADERDRGEIFVAENYEALRERKVFSALVPSELGGGGLPHSQMCAFVRALAHYCGSTALALRDRGHALPRRLAMISPMLDLTGGSDTFATLTHVDPDYSDTTALLDPAAAYAADTPLDHPLVSPVLADPTGLPPTLVQVGNREVLLGDSARFARAARGAGVDVRLEVLDGVGSRSRRWDVIGAEKMGPNERGAVIRVSVIAAWLSGSLSGRGLIGFYPREEAIIVLQKCRLALPPPLLTVGGGQAVRAGSAVNRRTCSPARER